MVELPDIESAVRMGDIFAQLVERLGFGARRVDFGADWGMFGRSSC